MQPASSRTSSRRRARPKGRKYAEPPLRGSEARITIPRDEVANWLQGTNPGKVFLHTTDRRSADAIRKAGFAASIDGPCGSAVYAYSIPDSKHGPAAIEVVVDLANPLEGDSAQIMHQQIRPLRRRLAAEHGLTGIGPSRELGALLRDALLQAGHDGLLLHTRFIDGSYFTELVAFRPEHLLIVEDD